MPAKKSSRSSSSKSSKATTRTGASGRKSSAGGKTASGRRSGGGDNGLAGLFSQVAETENFYTAVFLINPQQSTPQTLRVAWPETCLACGHWFDFPASAVESIVPLGVEECCNAPLPKVGLRIRDEEEDLIRMLRSHLTGTLGVEMNVSAAPTRTRAMAAVTTSDEEMCGSDAPAPQKRAATRGGVNLTPTAEDEAAPDAATATTFELSGPHWVARFPTSRSLFDCKPPFLDRISKFHQALVEAGAQVKISATLRPAERAYLMHFSSKIASGKIDPRKVPPMAGVSIKWFHGDLAKSKNAAQQMVHGYGIAFPPALHSRHTEGLAVDMTITWSGTLQIKDATGAVKSIGAPQSGNTNQALHKVGASYGVIKLASDPPHWSSDGH